MTERFNIASTLIKRKELRKNQTEAESLLWNKLRNRNISNIKFFRQYGIGPYIADFYSPKLKLVIEIDGSQHCTIDGLEYDKEREDYMKSIGIATLRFTNNEVINNIEKVIVRIINKIEE